jgi:large subunit ribosomal protein L20
MKALRNSYIDRRRKKRTFRRLWITRIGAAAKLNGISYSAFMGGLERRGIAINRKMLADIAVRDEHAFSALAEIAKGEAVKG